MIAIIIIINVHVVYIYYNYKNIILIIQIIYNGNTLIAIIINVHVVYIIIIIIIINVHVVYIIIIIIYNGNTLIAITINVHVVYIIIIIIYNGNTLIAIIIINVQCQIFKPHNFCGLAFSQKFYRIFFRGSRSLLASIRVYGILKLHVYSLIFMVHFDANLRGNYYAAHDNLAP